MLQTEPVSLLSTLTDFLAPRSTEYRSQIRSEILKNLRIQIFMQILKECAPKLLETLYTHPPHKVLGLGRTSEK